MLVLNKLSFLVIPKRFWKMTILESRFVFIETNNDLSRERGRRIRKRRKEKQSTCMS
jgi:hypothetical protein